MLPASASEDRLPMGISFLNTMVCWIKIYCADSDDFL